MNKKCCELRILPLFEDDLNRIVDYMADRPKSQSSAESLIDAVEEAIDERRNSAESFEPFYSAKERRYPYYRINVQNYIVYYVMIDNIMEVRRILYNRSDLKRYI